MNRQQGFIIPLLIILAAALGVGGYFYAKTITKHKEETVMQQQTNTGAPLGTTAAVSLNTPSGSTSVEAKVTIPLNKVSMTLQELLAKGYDLECSGTTINPEGAMITGTTYISNGNMRGDIVTTTTSATTKGGMLLKGNTVYSWNGNKGVEVTLTASFDLNAALSMINIGSTNQKVTYSCTPWIVDTTKFTAPAGVQFKDYGSVSMSTISASLIQGFLKGR